MTAEGSIKLAETKHEIDLKYVKDTYDEYITGLKLKLPFYCAIPGDVDFIVTGIPINKQMGSAMVIRASHPTTDLKISISNYEERKDKLGNTKDFANFSISGVIGNNLIPESNGIPIEMKRHSFSGPINATSHEFYIFVADIDTKNVYLNIARRKLKDVGFEVTVMPFGSVDIQRPSSFVGNCGSF